MIQISTHHYAWPWQITDVHYEHERYGTPEGWYVYLKDAQYSRIKVSIGDKSRILAELSEQGGDDE